jgi:hypothetical protein
LKFEPGQLFFFFPILGRSHFEPELLYARIGVKYFSQEIRASF